MIVEKLVGEVGGLRVDVIAEDTREVKAKLRLRLVAGRQAGGEECVVADFLNDGELRAGNVRGEKFGIGIEGNDGIGRARENLNRTGDCCERVRREGRAQSRGDGENGADARIAMWLGAFTKRGLQGGISFSERADFRREPGKFGRVRAHAIGIGRFTESFKAGKIADAAGDFDDREAPERKTCCANAPGVDARAEGGISEHGVEDRGQVVGAFPPD